MLHTWSGFLVHTASGYQPLYPRPACMHSWRHPSAVSPAAAKLTASPTRHAPAHEQEALGLGAAAPCGAGARPCRRRLGGGCVGVVVLRQHQQLIPCACSRASDSTSSGLGCVECTAHGGDRPLGRTPVQAWQCNNRTSLMDTPQHKRQADVAPVNIWRRPPGAST